MELTGAQYEQSRASAATRPSPPSISAILYVADHGCKCRVLPARFGSWHSIYTRMNRWAKKGVLDDLFAELQRQQIIRARVESVFTR